MAIFSGFIRRLLPAVILSAAAIVPAHAQLNTDRTLAVGQNALYFEDYMLSIQYFNQVIAVKPYLAKPYFLRAIAKLNLDDYAGAEADASKAIELNPYITDAWEVRGVARQNMGNNAGAIADYDHALSLLPRNRHLLFNKALAQQEIKDYTGADSTFCNLVEWYPGYDNAYLGRARLRLLQADTVAARADIDKALQLNANALNAYIMRADIAINSAGDYEAALADMDHAIKLQPKFAGLYINRAFLRYSTNDFFGAMADYDYAIQLEPANTMALFNRGLLLTEVHANDRALEDFNAVLAIEPDDYRSLYNRAMLYNLKGNNKAAIADIDRVIEAFPDFPGAYYMRSSIYNDMRDLTRAERDYKKALALAKAAKPVDTDADTAPPAASDDDVPDELVSRRFATLLTVSDNAEIEEEYNNQAIRGKVQDRDVQIEIEPMMLLSYYNSPTELRQNTYYIKEIDDLNNSRTLRFMLVVTNSVPPIDENMAQRHFKSIENYNSYMATHTPRAVDYIGRAMDLITIRDYSAALTDIERAIAITPDFAPAYFLRAQARYLKQLADQAEPDPAVDIHTREALRRSALADVQADLDIVLRLAPQTAPAWFDKGNMMVETGDFTSAIAAYSRAIDIKPDMGEAYYNRGYVYLKLGNRKLGIADLSKAGELGILPAYNLIKRISK